MAGSLSERIVRIGQSFLTKMVVSVVIFAVVPVLIYDLLDRADGERNALLLRTMQEESRLVSEALFPHLEEFSPGVAEDLTEILSKLAAGGSTIKILFRPTGSHNPKSFFFVASHPPISGDLLEVEQKRVAGTDLLSQISDSCDYRRSLALDFVNTTGSPEILTYLGARVASNGCWVVLTSLDRNLLLSFSPDRPYWQTPELKFAIMIYVLMVLLVLSIFAGAWISLRNFSLVAQLIRRGAGGGVTFRKRNKIPELDGVAAEFDAFVAALRRSEELIRQAAEENAHALKAPLAVISQSLEPIRSALPSDNKPAARSLMMIEKSIERLDGQISAARRIEEATAELMDQQFIIIDLFRLLPALVEDYRALAEDRRVRIQLNVAPQLKVMGNDNLIETAIENVLENALDFAPSGSVVQLSAFKKAGFAIICIDDDGPGIQGVDQERVFSRHFSTRMSDGVGGNFGIGLWIVRRNIEAMGGTVTASNRAEGGLRIEIALLLR